MKYNGKMLPAKLKIIKTVDKKEKQHDRSEANLTSQAFIFRRLFKWFCHAHAILVFLLMGLPIHSQKVNDNATDKGPEFKHSKV
jgi:hypothetical protein